MAEAFVYSHLARSPTSHSAVPYHKYIRIWRARQHRSLMCHTITRAQLFKAMASIRQVTVQQFFLNPPAPLRQLDDSGRQHVMQWQARPDAMAYVHEHGFLLYCDLPVLYVAFIYVAPAHRGKGIASLLLNQCRTPCVATIVDRSLWLNNGWQFRQVSPSTEVAFKGPFDAEQQSIFDGEYVVMVLNCRLPLQVHQHMLRDEDFADRIGSALMVQAHTIMAVRQTLVQRGVPVHDALQQALATTHALTSPTSED